MDKRVFNFSDSVYRALEHAEGLAIEVNPDEMMSYAITQTVNNGGRKLDEILGEEDYRKYGPQLSKKLKKPAAQITSKDILAERNRWITTSNFKESMQTFVDAWLYGVAKATGKWVGGIEDIIDQGNLLDELINKVDIESVISGEEEKKSSSTLAKMIKIYEEQDLEAIELMSREMNDDQRYQLLGKRNIKMAHRIDSLAAVRSVFFAVGAAHLPGNDGLISLLKEKGFKVEPVVSEKRIPAHQYKYEPMPVTWSEVDDPSYSIEMPGNPTMVKLYGLIETFFYMDIFNFTGYYSISSNKSIGSGKSLEETIRSMYPSGKIEKLKLPVRDSLTMADYLVTDNGLHLRVRLASYNNNVFVLMMFAKDKARLSGADAERYLNSFKVKTSESGIVPNYTSFSDSIMGISMSTTTPLTFNAQLSNDNSNNWKVAAYTSTDMAKGLIVMLLSKEVKRHWVLNSEADINKDLESAFEKTYGKFQSKDTMIDGIPARLFYDMKNPDYPALRAKVVSVIRGNRNLLISITSDTSTTNRHTVNDILNSIKFNIEQESKNWTYYPGRDSAYITWAPSAITTNQVTPYSLFDRTEMAAYDTLTATSYMVLHDQPRPYYWVSNYEEWKDIYKSMIYDESDSILYQKDVDANGMKGYEILIKKEAANTFKRSRILLGPNGTYILSVSSQEKALFTTNVDHFFTDFKQSSGLGEFDYLEPKATLLLNALKEADSTTRVGAIAYLRSAPFSANDVDLLNRSLFNAYQPLYELADSFDVSETISEHLQKLGASSTIAYIKNYYPTIRSEDQARKNIALTTLAGIHTSDSYQVFASLLSKAAVSRSPSMRLRRNLMDSLALTSTIADKLLPLSADSIYTPCIAAIMSKLIDSNFVKQDVLKPFAPYFIENARKLLTAINDSTEYDYQVSNLIELLPLLNNEEANKVLKAFQFVVDIDIQITAVLALLKHGMVADPKMVEHIALDRSYRVYLFEMLRKINMQHLFPQKLLSQRSFAACNVFNASDDYFPMEVVFVGEKEAVIGEKKYRFHLFKLVFEEEGEKSSFLGIAGGYTLNTALEPETEMTGIYWDEEYSRNKIDDQFKKYINNFSGE